MRVKGKSLDVRGEGRDVMPTRRRIAVLSCPCALKRLILWNCHAALACAWVMRNVQDPGAYEYYAYAAYASTHKQTRQRNNIQFYAKVLHNKITSANCRAKSVKSQKKDQQTEPLIHLQIIFGIKIAWHKRQHATVHRPPSWNIFLISATGETYFCDFRTAIAGFLVPGAWCMGPGSCWILNTESWCGSPAWNINTIQINACRAYCTIYNTMLYLFTRQQQRQPAREPENQQNRNGNKCWLFGCSALLLAGRVNNLSATHLAKLGPHKLGQNNDLAGKCLQMCCENLSRAALSSCARAETLETIIKWHYKLSGGWDKQE